MDGCACFGADRSEGVGGGKPTRTEDDGDVVVYLPGPVTKVGSGGLCGRGLCIVVEDIDKISSGGDWQRRTKDDRGNVVGQCAAHRRNQRQGLIWRKDYSRARELMLLAGLVANNPPSGTFAVSLPSSGMMRA